MAAALPSCRWSPKNPRLRWSTASGAANPRIDQNAMRMDAAKEVERSIVIPSTRVFPRLWALVLVLLPLCSLARVALCVGYAGSDRSFAALAPALAQGLRYDLVLGAGASLAIALLVWPLQLLRNRPALPARTAAGLATGLLAITALTAVGEYYYYSFYKIRFDPIAFGLFDEDTVAVLKAIWIGYPVLPALGAVALAVGLLAWSLQRMAAWLDANWPEIRWPRLFVGLQLVALLLLARGSFGTFPLTRQDLAISPDSFVNGLVYNPPLSLYNAYKANEQQVTIGHDAQEGLRYRGFADLGMAARAAGISADDPGSVAAKLFATAPGTPRPLAESPHVVLALLESFGADLLFYDKPTNDMLGRLRPFLDQGHVFENLFTSRIGTHRELEYVLLGTPISPLTQGNIGAIPFDTCAALPFRRAGYRTALLYGGSSNWRNIGRVFEVQGFDRVYGSRDIKGRFPEARGSDSKLYDEFLFDFAAELLEQADARGERLFLVVLSTTNHPPYEFHGPRRELPIDIGALGPRAAKDKAELGRSLITYQYQADQFGAFLERITRGPAGQRLVLAAAGDHNMRTHFRYDLPTEQPDVDRVFGYLYTADAFRPATRPDLSALGDHGDLVPTLVSLALPGARYFDTGRNLMAPVIGPDFALAMNERVYTDAGMLAPLKAPEVHAWVDDRRLNPQGLRATPEQVELASLVEAQVALHDWHIRRQVIEARDADDKGRPPVAVAARLD
jgi:phosphoglycerol transferase MdoB-like AlkP superfamily enzyme